jgi:hypothetical protein
VTDNLEAARRQAAEDARNGVSRNLSNADDAVRKAYEAERNKQQK